MQRVSTSASSIERQPPWPRFGVVGWIASPRSVLRPSAYLDLDRWQSSPRSRKPASPRSVPPRADTNPRTDPLNDPSEPCLRTPTSTCVPSQLDQLRNVSHVHTTRSRLRAELQTV